MPPRKNSKPTSAATFIKERSFETQRFYPDDRVRLRTTNPEVRKQKGTVIRSNIREAGGTIVAWDHKPGRMFLHNPRYLENVWIDPETGLEEE